MSKTVDITLKPTKVIIKNIGTRVLLDVANDGTVCVNPEIHDEKWLEVSFEGLELNEVLEALGEEVNRIILFNDGGAHRSTIPENAHSWDTWEDGEYVILKLK